MTTELEDFAAYLTRAFEASHLVILGTTPSRVEHWGLTSLPFPTSDLVDDQLARSGVLVCVNGADFELASALSAPLVRLLRRVPVAVVATPQAAERASPEQLAARLRACGLEPSFVGRAPDKAFSAGGLVAVLEQSRPLAASAPGAFRVVAFMRTYNEEDIIEHSIGALTDQGIAVYILDGWSTDRTITRAERWLGRGLLAIERFPAEGPSPYHLQIALLRRIEQLSAGISADWFIHHDADERRQGPWTGLSLRDALYRVDQAGYSCVDHTVIEFPPTSQGFDDTRDFAEQLTHFRFITESASLIQRKAWKSTGQRVSLAASGGHDVTFPNRRVYPFKFLLRHYPFRTPVQAARKIFRDRRPRIAPTEAIRGWNTHYLKFAEDETFLADPAELELYDQATFNERFLIQRLSGLGAYRSSARDRKDVHESSFSAIPRSPSGSQATLGARLIQPPGLDPMRPEPGIVLVIWETGTGTPGTIYVSEDRGAEALFATGTRGEQTAPWVQPHRAYRFRLYTGIDRGALLAELEVSYRP